jgi:hypothetical protein
MIGKIIIYNFESSSRMIQLKFGSNWSSGFVAVSFIGGVNRSNQRKASTCHKSVSENHFDYFMI